MPKYAPFQNLAHVFGHVEVGEIGAVAKLNWHGLAPIYHLGIPPMFRLKNIQLVTFIDKNVIILPVQIGTPTLLPFFQWHPLI